jgi:hypothetical protein
MSENRSGRPLASAPARPPETDGRPETNTREKSVGRVMGAAPAKCLSLSLMRCLPLLMIRR